MAREDYCFWCNPDSHDIRPHYGPHATWCPHFREEQRGGVITEAAAKPQPPDPKP